MGRAGALTMGVLRSYCVTTATSASSRACQRVRTIVGEAPLSQPIISRSLPYRSSAVKWVEKERETPSSAYSGTLIRVRVS